ncbi:hypothetical protein LOK49_LG04G03398 [Camellia lanceoleosa]|uniref:Uncharacterized protein n=1 Tax=Camellia lanceoleosa TaxID=1840588 RepID=A0ACC0HV23_9ERIC|nr:hypothetical protein LOK49_LG04G03398 [Camellia lanceoleosa]
MKKRKGKNRIILSCLNTVSTNASTVVRSADDRRDQVLLILKREHNIELVERELDSQHPHYCIKIISYEVLKNMEYDALRIVFNKFGSVVLFMPTTATILSPEIVEKETEAGGKIGDLDSYEIEGGETRSEILQNPTQENKNSVLLLKKP